MKTIIRSISLTGIYRLLSIILFVSFCTSCIYMKMNPASDVDKRPPAPPPPDVDNTCWMATAANMLAGAGYGDGTTLQDRAEDIYNELITWQTDATNPTGKAEGGWTDAALSWWLSSNNNTWANNPYTVVTVYGHKSPRYPWANTNGARDIGNELRSCNLIGLSISWPTNIAGEIGSGGHAITCWGDRSRLPWKDYNHTLDNNPTKVRLTDSDTDTGGDVQEYSYDTYTNTNPGGANEGNGWYIDYDPNHPYIKHIVVLSPTQTASGRVNTVRVIGSYRIHQNISTNATDLHYEVGTDVEILSYITYTSWLFESSPEIEENQPQRTNLIVDWDFTDKPVPMSTWVTITTEFILPNWNAIEYNDVHFTYPSGITGMVIPDIRWELETPIIDSADYILNVTGGYVIASFELENPQLQTNQRLIGEYRLIHQYSYDQDPEQHVLTLKGRTGYEVANVQVGHSYGLLNIDELWAFEDWMTKIDSVTFKLSNTPNEIQIDWTDLLPYPEGEDIKGRIKDIKSGLLLK